MIIVPTIVHTGTCFTIDHLFADVPKIRNPKRGFGVFWAHVWAERMPEIIDRMGEGHPIVVPLRPPVNVALSWKKRERNLAELDQQWRRMRDIIDHYDPMYLPVESPHREVFLDKIRHRLDMPLHTDWRKIASIENEGISLTDEEIKQAERWNEFYGKNSTP